MLLGSCWGVVGDKQIRSKLLGVNGPKLRFIDYPGPRG